MADTEKKSGLASRMEDFYFEIEDPDGKTETIGDAAGFTDEEEE
jgi:hypothetical protein